MTNLEWLKTPLRRHALSTLLETLFKVRSLKDLQVYQWAIDSVANVKQHAYAAYVSSATGRISKSSSF